MANKPKKTKKPKAKEVWNSVNHTRDSLSGKFMSKPRKKVEDIRDKKDKEVKEKFKKAVAKMQAKAKLSSKSKKKRLK